MPRGAEECGVRAIAHPMWLGFCRPPHCKGDSSRASELLRATSSLQPDATTKAQVRNVAGRLRGRWVGRARRWLGVDSYCQGPRMDRRLEGIRPRESLALRHCCRTEPFGRQACHHACVTLKMAGAETTGNAHD